MKKCIVVLLIMSFVLSLVACFAPATMDEVNSDVEFTNSSNNSNSSEIESEIDEKMEEELKQENILKEEEEQLLLIEKEKEEEIREKKEEDKTDVPESYSLDVPNIMQEPELPTGCEVTALTIVLNHLGFEVDKCDMADNYLPQGAIGTVTANDAFIGNPRDPHSYGCYSPVIVKCANDYLSDMNSDLKAYDLSGSAFEDLYKEIYNGRPVIIWDTMYLKEPFYTTKWNINGEEFVWKANLHCMVMTGYDTTNNTVEIADPLVGNTTYPLDTFKDLYEKMFSQAVIIK